MTSTDRWQMSMENCHVNMKYIKFVL